MFVGSSALEPPFISLVIILLRSFSVQCVIYRNSIKWKWTKQRDMLRGCSVKTSSKYRGLYLHRVWIKEIQQSFTEHFPNLLVILSRKMGAWSGPYFRPSHRRLHRVTILHAHGPHYNPSRTFFTLFHVKFAVFKRELKIDYFLYLFGFN